jgi:cob(I)alamin adenosyltransferase
MESEKDFLARLEPEIKFFRFAKSDAPFDQLSEEEQEEERINLKNGFNYGKKVIATGGCDVVVLDEFLGLVDLKIISMEDIKEMIAVKPEDMTLILTGRVLTEEIRRMADEIYNIAPEK